MCVARNVARIHHCHVGSDTAPFSVSAGSPPRSRGLTDSSTLPVSPQPTFPRVTRADDPLTRCHVYRGTFIPVCWSSVVHGDEDHCVCDGSAYARELDRRSAAMERLRRMRDRKTGLRTLPVAVAMPTGAVPVAFGGLHLVRSAR